MITSLSVKDFKAVPYLETSQLIANNPTVKFTHNKPNVIVGPNGAGKSALLKALSFYTLSNYLGVSCLDDNYIVGRDADALWANIGSAWREEFVYLHGLAIVGDRAPAMYYRPNHIPGNERMIAAAMMMGYCEEAKAYGELTKRKSDGQKSLAVQARIMEFLQNPVIDGYQRVNWHYRGVDSHKSDNTSKAQVLTNLYRDCSGTPMLLMDEPEQSLDTLAEVRLWKTIENADCSKLQIIVASHSMYPVLYNGRFNLIEAMPGYIDSVLASF